MLTLMQVLTIMVMVENYIENPLKINNTKKHLFDIAPHNQSLQ